jgi:hypothetical protein
VLKNAIEIVLVLFTLHTYFAGLWIGNCTKEGKYTADFCRVLYLSTGNGGFSQVEFIVLYKEAWRGLIR